MDENDQWSKALLLSVFKNYSSCGWKVIDASIDWVLKGK